MCSEIDVEQKPTREKWILLIFLFKGLMSIREYTSDAIILTFFFDKKTTTYVLGIFLCCGGIYEHT